MDADDEFHSFSNRIKNMSKTFTSVSELVERLRGNNSESVNASVTRTNNEIMSDLHRYHQILMTLKRRDESESNYAEIKLIKNQLQIFNMT